jgi:Icc protein
MSSTHSPKHSGVLRVIQLSDCHVSADPGARYRGADPRATLDSVLALAGSWRPDLLLATGDLSEDASPAAYRHLAQRMGRLGVPVLSLPGNHDLAAEQCRWFPACPVNEPWVHEAGDWQVVLLNSSVENQVPGRLSTQMLDGLHAVLNKSPGKPRLVLLHHQPILVDSPWIDRYPLLQSERLWRVLDQSKDVRIVAWGHIHHVHESRRRSVCLLGAPSTVSNSLPGQSTFTTDSAGPACRWFQLSRGGDFSTGILRLGDDVNRLAATATG